MATIIPVLFLPLTLQGSFLVSTLIASVSWFNRAERQLGGDAPASVSRGLALQRTVAGTIYTYSFIVVGYGVAGEIQAVLALERQKASASTQSTITTAVIILIAATVVAFLVRFLESLSQQQKQAASDACASGEPNPTEP